jgi:hypothetical protein
MYVWLLIDLVYGLIYRLREEKIYGHGHGLAVWCVWTYIHAYDTYLSDIIRPTRRCSMVIDDGWMDDIAAASRKIIFHQIGSMDNHHHLMQASARCYVLHWFAGWIIIIISSWETPASISYSTHDICAVQWSILIVLRYCVHTHLKRFYTMCLRHPFWVRRQDEVYCWE